MLYSRTHMATVGVKGLKSPARDDPSQFRKEVKFWETKMWNKRARWKKFDDVRFSLFDTTPEYDRRME